MRDFMRDWTLKFEERYGVEIIAVNWCRWENVWKVQVYGEKAFGSIPGEAHEIARMEENIHLAIDYQGMRFIWVKEEQNANN